MQRILPELDIDHVEYPELQKRIKEDFEAKGIPQAREEYIACSRGKPFFCAFDAERPVGFLYLKETGRHTVEVAVMGVARECHRQGIGRSLFEQAREKAGQLNFKLSSEPCAQPHRYGQANRISV